MENVKDHWNKIYSKKEDNEVSWFQPTPETSISIIDKYVTSKSDKVIDIGGGNSNLTKLLCELGYESFSVLDISQKALERCEAKLSECKASVEFLEADILQFKSVLPFQIWHDRAVFHFLTEPEEINKYVEIVSDNIEMGGYFILSTFSTTGPEKCSGLQVSRYNAEMLETIFSQNFSMLESFDETHVTPSEATQDFVWVVFKRK